MLLYQWIQSVIPCIPLLGSESGISWERVPPPMELTAVGQEHAFESIIWYPLQQPTQHILVRLHFIIF